MSIGLKRGAVAVENHQNEWEISAEKIINLLKYALKDDIVDAQHIGSTSIKNICAKPIIDIVVGINDFNDIFKHNDELEKLGIIYRRQDHENQHLYVCGDLQNNIQTHYIHVVIFNSKEWNDYINMRDYLNANQEKALEYSKLKEQLAKKYPNDRIAYTNGKSKLIEEILNSASMWRKQMKNCDFCKIIEKSLNGENLFFVKELETGIVILGWNQHFYGYTIFICKQHSTELYQLNKEFRAKFMEEMILVSKAVAEVFKCDKMNYECLGNGDSHLHWHLFPRIEGDLGLYGNDGKGPVWWLPQEIMWDKNNIPNKQELEDMKTKLLTQLDKEFKE